MLLWGWYDDLNTCRLFIHCLLRANWKSGEWHGINYNAGQFITSLQSLAKESGLTVQQVRTALSHLKSTGEITDTRIGNCRVITINNWNEYQCDNKPSNKQSTNQQQAYNKPLTTDIEVKKERIKDINNSVFKKPTIDEVKEYCESRNNGIVAEVFIDFYESKGWMIGKNKMKDWKAAVRTWERFRKEDKNSKPQPNKTSKGMITASRSSLDIAKEIYGE